MTPREPGQLTAALLALTFATGIVDAASFLGLGQVFAAMQTGNVIFLGLGIADAADAPVVAPLIALLAFLAGGALAALLVGRHASRAVSLGVAAECGLLLAATVLAATADPDPGTGTAYLTIVALSLAMGLRNTLARRLGGENLATTVLNLTLAALTTPVPGLASREDLTQRTAGFLAILLGAVTGALLLKTSLALALAAAATITLAAGLMQLRARAVEVSPA
ncbi:MAG TPA: YoaK family protein [Solirubrobacterales bacterium]|nr:YoaK family protein [Solirubrobacterales bacterium]